MKLFYYSSNIFNFGDALNEWLWPKIFPDLFDNDEKIIFIGIGTILDSRIPENPFKVVFGSGVRYPQNPPKIDCKWDIRALRGKLSAKILGIDEKVSITDPAILVNLFFKSDFQKCYKISYMPYFRSASKDWELACKLAGVKYIDPRKSIEECFLDIARSEYLISEAMHGAIVADAFRVPWIPVRSLNKFYEDSVHNFKWNDWCSSLNLAFRPIDLPVLWYDKSRMISLCKNYIKILYIAFKLHYIKKKYSFNLSDNIILQENFDKYLDVIEQFKKDYKI
ncbi:hypothetical protein JCM12298_16280 [Desulfothermus naphthae]